MVSPQEQQSLSQGLCCWPVTEVDLNSKETDTLQPSRGVSASYYRGALGGYDVTAIPGRHDCPQGGGRAGVPRGDPGQRWKDEWVSSGGAARAWPGPRPAGV